MQRVYRQNSSAVLLWNLLHKFCKPLKVDKAKCENFNFVNLLSFFPSIHNLKTTGCTQIASFNNCSTISGAAHQNYRALCDKSAKFCTQVAHYILNKSGYWAIAKSSWFSHERIKYWLWHHYDVITMRLFTINDLFFFLEMVYTHVNQISKLTT